MSQSFGCCRTLVSSALLAWSFAGVCPVAASAQQSEAQARVAGAVAGSVEQGGGEQAPAPQRSSPWLLVPLVSSNPKLGTSFGGLGAYLHVFDPGSRVSMFGVNLQYTSTDSTIALIFARTSFRADHHRIVMMAAFGYIKNDYDDFLGSGQPLRTNDHVKALTGRYVYRLKGDWFIGARGVAADYQVLGESALDDLVLETLGVQGFNSSALGAVVIHDSRDNQDMPTRGWFLDVNNLAYREALGGSASFDAYRADLRGFWRHGGGHVLALRQFNWLTSDAPGAAQATVVLRGYTRGEHLAPYMSLIEAEERLSLSPRWGVTLFAGVAGLYGASGAFSDSNGSYPTVGAGVQFVIRPVQRMLVNLEYAQGVEGHRAVLLKFGYDW